MWPIIWTITSKLKHFSRSQTVMYTVKLVMSWKQCNILTLLLQITYRTSYGPSNIAIFNDLGWPLKVTHILQAFQTWLFCTDVQHLTWRQLTECHTSRASCSFTAHLLHNYSRFSWVLLPQKRIFMNNCSRFSYPPTCSQTQCQSTIEH